jgi:hypothetical protein
LAKAYYTIVLAFIPLKRDAIDELGLALANLNRFSNVLALAKIDCFQA